MAHPCQIISGFRLNEIMIGAFGLSDGIRQRAHEIGEAGRVTQLKGVRHIAPWVSGNR
jgi:hypothetical protein